MNQTRPLNAGRVNRAGAALARQAAGVTLPGACRFFVWSAALLFTAIFVTSALRHYEAFGVQTFDQAIFDQGLWLLSRGKAPFVTLRGLNIFGEHSSFIMVLLVPLYWAWPDPQALIVATVVIVAVGAPIVYAIGRAVDLDPRPAALMSVLYLLTPAVGWTVWWGFHPELMAIPFLLLGFLFVLKDQPWWAVLMVGLVLLAKEDATLVVAPFGLWMMCSRKSRTAGGIVVAASVAVFMLNMYVLIPLLSPVGEHPLLSSRYGRFGDGAIGIVVGVLTGPVAVARLLADWARGWYLVQLLAPFALAIVWRPRILLIGIPIALANLLSAIPYQFDIRYQYTACLIAIISVAAVVGIRKAQDVLSTRWLMALLGAMLLVGIAANVAWSPSPIGFQRNAFAAPTPEDRRIDEVLSLIPPDAVVSADPFIAPHLTRRDRVYMFPNPFEREYWSVPSQPPADAGNVEWVVATRSDDRTPILDYLVDSGDYRTVFDNGTLVLLTRNRPL